jgi:hypothetical protein
VRVLSRSEYTCMNSCYSCTQLRGVKKIVIEFLPSPEEWEKTEVLCRLLTVYACELYACEHAMHAEGARQHKIQQRR